MKRELLVPLLLIVGVSMLVTPIAANEGENVIPVDLESHGYGKMKIGEKWGFWPIYCRGSATFNYYTYTFPWDSDAFLDIYGRRCHAWADWWFITDVLDMEACGPIFTFELPAPEPEWDTNGFEIGGAKVVVFVMSGVPDNIEPLQRLEDPDACGIVVVYGCGYFYIGRIDNIDWVNYVPEA